MALGVSFVAADGTGYQDDLMSYLFGSVLFGDGARLGVDGGGLVVLVVATVCALLQSVLAIAFNEELARLRGVRTGFYEDAFFHVLTGADRSCCGAGMAGIVLAIALLDAAGGDGGFFSRGVWDRMDGGGGGGGGGGGVARVGRELRAPSGLSARTIVELAVLSIWRPPSGIGGDGRGRTW
jgi:hypothetical protein